MKFFKIALTVLLTCLIAVSVAKEKQTENPNRVPASSGTFVCEKVIGFLNDGLVDEVLNATCDTSKPFTVTHATSSLGLVCCIAK